MIKIEGVVFYIKHGVCVCILCHFIRLSLICHRIIPRLQTGASGSDCERVGGPGCHWADVELSRWRRLAADDLRRSVCVDDSTWRRITTTFTFHWRRGHCSMACRRRGDSIRAFLYCGLTVNGLVQIAITVFTVWWYVADFVVFGRGRQPTSDSEILLSFVCCELVTLSRCLRCQSCVCSVSR